MHNAVFCFCVIYGYKVIAKPCNLNYIILFHCNLYCYRFLQLECVILTSPGLRSKRSVECEKSSDSHTTKRRLEDVAPPSNSDLNCFFESISNEPAILKITPPYSKEFIPILSLAMYPKPIMELYNPAALELRYHGLLTECERTINSIEVSLM